jgi:polar amino acid transport system substrate-binding protein
MIRRRLRACLLVVGLLAPGGVRAEALVLSQIEKDPQVALSLEVVREAYRRLGIVIATKPLPNERALVAADAGETGGDLIRIAGLESRYPNLIRVPEPVLFFDSIAFTTGLRFPVSGWDSLRPYHLCVLRGNKLAELGTEGMSRDIAPTIETMGRMVVAGRCQVAVMGRLVWLEIDRLGLKPLISLEPPVQSVPLYHYVHRRHADLVPKLAEALRQMRADGTSARLSAVSEQAIEAARRRAAGP